MKRAIDIDGATGTPFQLTPPVRFAQVVEAEEAAFWVYGRGIATAANKSLVSLVNVSASKVAKVHEVWIMNVTTATITGVASSVELHRITGHSSGTTILQSSDNGSGMVLAYETTDTLDTDISARTGSTVSGEVAAALAQRIWSNDEITLNIAIDQEAFEHGIQQCFPLWEATRWAKALVLRQNEGLTVKQVTSTTVGTFDVAMLVSQVG